MNKLISWYNQNRKKFWLIVLAIIIGIAAFRILITTQPQATVPIQNTETNQINTSNFNSIVISDQKSTVTGKKAEMTENEMTIIDNFVSYCNSKKIQEAYNLLSKECKEEMYPDIKKFQNLYYKPVFGDGQKNASIENWVKKTYKVNFKEDALTTGKPSNRSVIQDYITIVKDDEGNTKLNINKYIGRKEINKEAENENVKIKVIRSDAYMDYEIYTYEVQNKLEESIALGDIEDTELSYLTDINDLQYNAYNTDLTQEGITLELKQTKTVQIKYFNAFSSTREIKSVIFPNIILEYEQYATLGQKAGYTYNPTYTQMKIDL